MSDPRRILQVSAGAEPTVPPSRRLGFDAGDVDVRTVGTVDEALERLGDSADGGEAVDYLVVDLKLTDGERSGLLEGARDAGVEAVVLVDEGILVSGDGDTGVDVGEATSGVGDVATAGRGHGDGPSVGDGPTYLETVAESVPDGIVTIDADSVIQTANPGMETLFGYAPEELVGQPLTTIIPERLRDRHLEAIETYLERGDRSFDWSEVELPGLHRDGREIPLSISFSEFERDGERFFAGVMRDVSQRRAYESRLERQNRRLEEFASFVSHDLRTPLDEAALHLEMAQRRLDDPPTDHLEGVADSHDRMRRLVDDLLSFARAGQEAVDPEPVDLGELATTTWGAIGPVGGTLHVDDECRILADHGLLRQLLENLIRNAVEHGSTSPPSDTRQDDVEHGGDSVTVSVGTLDDGFYVADDGPGIPPADREAVFEPGHSTVADGTGFGLAIVRDVAAAHDWRVAATESDAGGARFEVTGVEFVER